MIVKETKLKGCFILEPKVFLDSRGYFFESFNQNTFNRLIGKNINFIQDNESKSSRGVLRGLHFQKPPFTQAKLVLGVLIFVIKLVNGVKYLLYKVAITTLVIKASASNKVCGALTA